MWGEQVRGSHDITVDLGGAHASVKLYDPMIGTPPAETLVDVGSVRLLMSDHPLVIEVSGGG